MEYPSKLVEDAVNEIAKLPGIGKKSALRIALHLLKQEEERTQSLGNALVNLRTKTQYCQRCHNIADAPICSVCNNRNRDHSIICVVESTTDLIAIENTSQYRGVYHVLGGVISPIEGISPGDIAIDLLLSRVSDPRVGGERDSPGPKRHYGGRHHLLLPHQKVEALQPQDHHHRPGRAYRQRARVCR